MIIMFKKSLFPSSFLFFFLLLFSTSSSWSQENAASIASFADSLFDEKDYYRSITEYKRLIHLYPESGLSKKAELKIGLSYLEGKQLEAARINLEKFINKYPDDPIRWDATFLLGEVHFRGKDYESAINYYSYAQEKAANADMKKKASMRKGNALLRGERWWEASLAFKSFEDEMPGLSTAARDGSKTPYKSPKMAGTLSAIIPGSGQMYIGRKKDAFSALLLNGLFIAGTYEAFRRDDYALGSLLLFFEVGWYTGNIYSAISGAHKFNRHEKEKYIEKLEKKYYLSATGHGDLLGIYKLRF